MTVKKNFGSQGALGIFSATDMVVIFFKGLNNSKGLYESGNQKKTGIYVT